MLADGDSDALGIAVFLGMATFGLVMLIGNLAFISPWLVRRFSTAPRTGRAGQGRGGGRRLPVAKLAQALRGDRRGQAYITPQPALCLAFSRFQMIRRR